MFDEFVDLSGSDDHAGVRSRRVRLCLLGIPTEVDKTIAALHRRRCAEINAWSQPLTLVEIGDLSTLYRS